MQLPALDYAALSAKPTSNTSKIPFIALVAGVIGVITGGLSGGSSAASLVPYLFLFVCAGAIIVILIQLYIRQRKQADMLARFALTNNLSLQLGVPNPSYNGLMFQVGDDRKLNQLVTIPTDGHPIEIGNYQYVTGSGKNRTTNVGGFVHLKLPRQVPNMVLDAKANNYIGMFSNLPTVFNKDQVLQLEGDFNKYFTLYAPQQYERDALYVFTPDVMATLIDYAGNYDIETVDNDLFIYASSPFNLATASTWQALLALVTKLSPEFEQQTDGYADERVANRTIDFVAQPGQRLRSGVGKFAILAIVFVVAVNGMQFLQYASDQGGIFASLSLLGVGMALAVGALIWKLFRRYQ